MSPVFAARRRAEEFDSLVDAASTGAVDAARYAELLEVVGALRSTPAPQARPEFVADLRERLMAAAETELAGSPAATAPAVEQRLTVRTRPARERRLAAAMGGFALVGATTSMAMAAQSALPGDALYPLKRAIENAHTGVSMGDGEKGSTLLANASGRLEEVDLLARKGGQTDVAAIEETLTAFTVQATEASDLLVADYQANADEASLLELEQFTAESFAALDALAPIVPVEAQDSLVEAGRTLTDIDSLVQQLCDTCEGAITSVPQWLLIAGEPATHTVPEVGTPPVVVPEVAATAPAAPVGAAGEGRGEDRPADGAGSGKPGTTGTPASSAVQPTGSVGAPAGQPTVGIPQQPAAPVGSSGNGGTKGTDRDPQPSGVAGVGGVVDGLTQGSSVNTQAPSLPQAPQTPLQDQVGGAVGGAVDGAGEVVGDLTNPLQP